MEALPLCSEANSFGDTGQLLNFNTDTSWDSQIRLPLPSLRGRKPKSYRIHAEPKVNQIGGGLFLHEPITIFTPNKAVKAVKSNKKVKKKTRAVQQKPR